MHTSYIAFPVPGERSLQRSYVTVVRHRIHQRDRIRRRGSRPSAHARQDESLVSLPVGRARRSCADDRVQSDGTDENADADPRSGRVWPQECDVTVLGPGGLPGEGIPIGGTTRRVPGFDHDGVSRGT